MTTFYDDEIDIDSFDAEGEDYFGGAEASIRYVTLQHFTGNQTQEIIGGLKGKGRVTSEREPYAYRGTVIPVERMKNDELLKSVVQTLIDSGKARMIVVQHSGGDEKNRGQYIELKSLTLFPLTLNVPSGQMITQDIRKATGMAAGNTIDWNPKASRDYALKVTYVDLLVVAKELYDAGYQDERGNPIPVRLSWKGYNASDTNKALQSHVQYVAFLRGAKTPCLNTRHKKGRVENELWEYAVELGLSDERVARGTAPDVSWCFVMKNLHEAEDEWTSELEQKLWCGNDLYPKLWRMVYKVDGQTRVPGGIAHDHCLAQLERNAAILRKLDPDNELRFGKNKIPARWLIADTLNEQNQLREAVRGDRETIAPLTPAEKVQAKINAYAALFKRDPEGTDLVQKARSATGKELADLIDDMEAHRAFLAEEYPF